MAPRRFAIDVGGGDARPERDRVGAQRDGDSCAALEKLEAALPSLRFRVDECRTLLAPRVEHVPCTRLDDDREIEALQEGAGRAELRVRRVVGVQVVRVGRDRHGAIAQLGDDVERVVETMVREPVRVVAEPERKLAHAPAVHRSSASYCLYRFISLEPSGVLKKRPSAPIAPDSPRCCASRTSRAMSRTSGAASTESVPSQVNCMRMRCPAQPRNWMKFHATLWSASGLK